MEYFVSLKQHWLVSIGALIMRSEQCELISATHALHLKQQVSRNGWRKKEPLNDKIPIEKPVLLESATKILIKKNYSLAQLSHDMFINIDMFNRLANLSAQKSVDMTPLKLL